MPLYVDYTRSAVEIQMPRLQGVPLEQLAAGLQFLGVAARNRLPGVGRSTVWRRLYGRFRGRASQLGRSVLAGQGVVGGQGRGLGI